MKTLLILAATLALAIPVDASHCTTWTTTREEANTNPLGVDGIRTLYVFNDETWCCLFSIWVYEETNGIPGAQRGDEVVDDTCHGMIASDTIVL
jgi:hypothetical protein